MRKIIGVGLAAGLLLALAALPAAAQDAYPPAAPVCSLTATSVPAGGTVTVTCDGFAPNTTVTATLNGVVLGTAQVDAAGNLGASFTIPADLAPGQYTLRLSGLNADGVATNVDLAITVVARTAVTPPAPGVTPPRVVSAPGLPRTGSEALLALGLAAGLLAAGGGALGVARRRNRATAG